MDKKLIDKIKIYKNTIIRPPIGMKKSIHGFSPRSSVTESMLIWKSVPTSPPTAPVTTDITSHFIKVRT